MRRFFHWTLAVCSLIAIVLVSTGSNCPPTVTKTGSHQTITFSAAGTAVTFTPPPGSSVPASVTLDILVLNYDDYSDGTKKLVGPANGVAVTLATDDPTYRCVKVSPASVITNAAGKARSTATAAASVLTACPVAITASVAGAANSPQQANVRNIPN